ncbi:MAG: hypothetical protein IKP92_06390 [Lachnospiraceae bacterium]|nr:hypothetical protein [Lachnospiraceae bacterium]
MGWLVFIVLIAICVVFTILGLKLCVALADMLGIDHENIPRKTFAPNGIYLGSIIGLLVLVLAKNAIVGLIAGLASGLLIFVIIFFIEVAITKATRPLTDKIEEKLTGAFEKSKPKAEATGELTPLERIAREEAAKEKAASENRLLAEGGWRCEKCGKVNVASLGFCACGTSRGESKKMAEERIRQREEMQRRAVSAASGEPIDGTFFEEKKASGSNEPPAVNISTAVNTASRPLINLDDYDLSILDEKLEGSMWRCLKCRTVNPRVVSTCRCGYTYDQNDQTIKRIRAERERQLKAQKEEQQSKIAEADRQILKRFQKFGIDNPTAEQKTIVRLLTQSTEGMTMAEICHKLPRSADLKTYQKIVEEMTAASVIETDANGKYKITD